MITPNTDSTFTQVKFDNPEHSYLTRCVVAELIRMDRQLSSELESSVQYGMKRKGKVAKRMRGLDDLLLNAVDETLRRVFRKEGTKVIYVFMENKCHLKREKIAEKPEDFSASLERLLSSAAPMIEKMILENLYSKFQLKYEKREGYQFSDFIKELKEKCVC